MRKQPYSGPLALVFVLLLGISGAARADNFYESKTIRFIVGFAAGGGYDAYTRTVARHISKYIPGSPATVVENMTGAGSVIAANYAYNRAEPDGLTVGVWNAHNIFNHAMGDMSVRLDGRKVGWIGAPGKDSVVCAIMGFTGLKTFQDILGSKKPVRMGATRGGNTVHLPTMMNKWAGTKFEVIPGYGGTAKIRLAMQSKEVDGACWTWESMRTTARSMLDAHGDAKLIPFIIHRRTEEPEVKNISLFSEVIKDKKNLHSYTVWNSGNEFARPFSVPPGTPKERLAILREAFADTMKDPAFLADAKKSKLDVNYVPWDDIEKIVAQVYSMPPEVKDNLEFLMRKMKKK